MVDPMFGASSCKGVELFEGEAEGKLGNPVCLVPTFRNEPNGCVWFRSCPSPSRSEPLQRMSGQWHSWLLGQSVKTNMYGKCYSVG